MAVLKYHILKLHNDDLKKLERDENMLDTMIKQGFRDLFAPPKPKPQKPKNDK